MSLPAISSVLIVDDERHIRHILEKIIRRIGLQTTWQAENGARAVELHEAYAPDLILLDINMPEMTGQEVLKLIREKDDDVYIIMITAMISRDAVESCAELGADQFISKGAPPKEIQAQLSEFIENASIEI